MYDPDYLFDRGKYQARPKREFISDSRKKRKENIVKVFLDNQFNRFKCDARSATRDSRYCNYLKEEICDGSDGEGRNDALW